MEFMSDLAAIFQFAPALVTAGAMVWMFLRYQEKRDALFTEALREISNEHHAACQSNTDVVKRNTEALVKVEATIDREAKLTSKLWAFLDHQQINPDARRD